MNQKFVTLSVRLLAVVLGLGAPLTSLATSRREAEAIAAAAVPLAQAIQIAEKQEMGKTVSVEFEIERDVGIWEVKVLANAGVDEYEVNATSGAVTKAEDEHLEGKIKNFITGTNLADLRAAKTPLVEAVAAAEAKLGGKAFEVEVEHEHGAVQYDIFVRADNRTKNVKIEAATGLPQ